MLCKSTFEHVFAGLFLSRQEGKLGTLLITEPNYNVMRKTYFYSDKSRKAKKNEKYFVLYALFPNIFLTFAAKRDKITPPMSQMKILH